MRTLGYLLIAAGFLAGSLAAVWETAGVPWAAYLTALLTGTFGVVAVRIGSQMETLDKDAAHTGQQRLEECLRRIVESLRELNSDREEVGVYGLLGEIDRRFPEDIGIFVDERQTLSRRYGLQAYADLMSHFAAGERYLNRVWCCSADGYVDEAHEFLDRAEEQFLEVARRLGELSATT